jgi:hypothetical protein
VRGEPIRVGSRPVIVSTRTTTMRIGRPIQLKHIQNKGDYFIPLYTKCKTCKKTFRMVAIEVVAGECLYGSRTLDCYKCGGYWEEFHAAVGGEVGALKKLVRVNITL